MFAVSHHRIRLYNLPFFVDCPSSFAAGQGADGELSVRVQTLDPRRRFGAFLLVRVQAVDPQRHPAGLAGPIKAYISTTFPSL